MATRDKIATLLLGMENLPNNPITEWNAERIVDSYLETLGDLSEELLDAAVQAYKAGGTFFPTAGDLRNKALELTMLAANVPTPAEAWRMFLDAKVQVQALERCATGRGLAEQSEKAGATGDYWRLVFAYDDHMKGCDTCRATSSARYVYAHPVVARVVELLGGREMILTDNPTADRARFYQACGEIIEREKTLAGLTPQVRGAIESARQLQSEPGRLISELTARVSR